MRLALKIAVEKICFIIFAGINLVIMFKGRNRRIGLFGVINVFRVDHQSLEERELEASFAVMLL